ncbi:MAG TPA: aromatic acid exporter family protein [Pseudolabrys sp.]|nr:aromatic acid exporter family protein [Pseudolabrys sp.]
MLIPVIHIQLAVRASVAAVLSLAIAQFFGLQFPIYAAVAAIIVTDLSPAETTLLGWRRMVASAIGAFTGAILTMVLPQSVWTVGLGILVAMLLCHFFRVSEVFRIAGYTSAIVILSRGIDPWHLAFERLLETALGIAVAWIISCVPKLLRSPPKDQPQ